MREKNIPRIGNSSCKDVEAGDGILCEGNSE